MKIPVLDLCAADGSQEWPPLPQIGAPRTRSKKEIEKSKKLQEELFEAQKELQRLKEKKKKEEKKKGSPNNLLKEISETVTRIADILKDQYDLKKDTATFDRKKAERERIKNLRRWRITSQDKPPHLRINVTKYEKGSYRPFLKKLVIEIIEDYSDETYQYVSEYLEKEVHKDHTLADPQILLKHAFMITKHLQI